MKKIYIFFSGVEKMKKYGTRSEVWAGAAQMTKGRLEKHHLFKHPRSGKLTSIARSQAAKKRGFSHLEAFHFKAKKKSKQ